MIEEITQLRQKTLDLLKENYQIRQELQAQQAQAEDTFFLFVNDILNLYDKSDIEVKRVILSLLEKNEITLIPMSTASSDNDYTLIVGQRQESTKRVGTILEFIKEGFICNQKIIRKAEVIVAA